MKADAVIVSAGKGQRFLKGRKKQFFSLDGKPILAHAIDQFEACPLIRQILLVVGQEDLDYCLEEIVEKYRYRKISQIIPGGKRRQESVKNGLDALPGDAEIIVIHDGVRPFVTKEMIEESIRSASRFGAVVTAIPVKDTIKMAHPDGTVLKTLERESLYQAQTPQTFQAPMIKEAYLRATEDGFIGTDDASLVERLGMKVHILPGSYANIKITTPEDLILANLFLKGKSLAKEEKQ
ncbi:MAG: 2-C-methyl-D-erythritol 4-phosphate cytidylyltransferase [Thermodesulfobacteriota bacterium]|nr:2-C-methyl-D-erythritol 4-phosphate cytidylyltransferase [Thermodesulfobacteriota bacterium]